MAYPRAVKPNYALDAANCLAMGLGAPALADVDAFVTSVAMGNKTFTLALTASPDGLARNVTITGTQQGGADDTFGTVTITGTDVFGNVITEALVPVNGSTVAGTKAFATITSVVQAGWTAGGAADLITVGFGNLIGVPAGALSGNGAFSDATQIFAAWLGGTAVAPTAVQDAVPSENTIDASSGTYDGSKALTVLMRR